MGEVYRAEDTNLDREVAIKVLPEQFTQDPQRLARFEPEDKFPLPLPPGRLALGKISIDTTGGILLPQVRRAIMPNKTMIAMLMAFLILIPAFAQDISSELIEAATSGQTETVQTLLEAGADVDAKDENRMTALMWAAYGGHTDAVEALLGKGAKVNAKHNKDSTALIFAVTPGGHADVVKALLEAGADVNVRDNDGVTPLMSAAGRGHTDAVEALLEAGADVDAKQDWGATALIFAAQEGPTQIVEALLSKGADVNAKQDNGWTALMAAAEQGHNDIVEALLDAGADVNPNDSELWNNAAYLYATAKDLDLRNPQKAVEYARKAVQTLPEMAPVLPAARLGREVTNLDTLAEAYLANGQFEAASDVWAEETLWEDHLDWAQDRLATCVASEPLNHRDPCHEFVAQALERIYSVTDFKLGDDYLRPSQIAELTSGSADWIEIGSTSEQQALATAQERANDGMAVIAVSALHVALILPGQVTLSGSWELTVPNSGSFFPKTPQKSYLGKGLSYAWQKTESVDVRLYYRGR